MSFKTNVTQDIILLFYTLQFCYFNEKHGIVRNTIVSLFHRGRHTRAITFSDLIGQNLEDSTDDIILMTLNISNFSSLFEFSKTHTYMAVLFLVSKHFI